MALLAGAACITTDAHTQSEAQYQERQRAINAEYDGRIRAAATPELRTLNDQERNSRLFELQRQQIESYGVIERLHAEMMWRISARQ